MSDNQSENSTDRSQKPKSHWRYDEAALPGWNQTAELQRKRIITLQEDLRTAEENLRIAEAAIRTCQNPPKARNVLFSQTMTSFENHFENAKRLQYSYVAWNDHLYTVDQIRLGHLDSFGL